MINKNNSALGDDADVSEKRVEDKIRDAIMKGGNAIYAKGDKIAVIKGDLVGLKGTVISIEDTTIQF